MTNDPRQPEPARADNRPPDREIPDILEWKLDIIMGQLARLGGGQPSEHNTFVPRTRERLPNPDDFDLEKDHIPHNPGIPDILEFKLDLLIRGLGRLLRTPVIINLNFLFANGLAAIIVLLILILLALLVIITQLTAINIALLLILAVLGLILFFILFVVIRIAVPFIRDNARRR